MAPAGDGIAAPDFDSGGISTEVVAGTKKLRSLGPVLRELRLRCGQVDDFTTDPLHVIAANTQRFRRVAAVLIRRKQTLEACVFFFEHCWLAFGFGVYHGGDFAGDGLVVGPRKFQAHYVHLASQTLLNRWRVYGVSLSVGAPAEQCLRLMGPRNQDRMIAGRNIKRRLPLMSTYEGMLASLGSRTRRSLAGKRQQLESRALVSFLPSLEPEEALQAMLSLRLRSLPRRPTQFFRARQELLRSLPNFFSMGLRLPNGVWLSLLSGWRQGGVTYVDLQMNDLHSKKESLSAVMRAFLLEHEINRGQRALHFVGGTSLLLRRYCEPLEPVTDIFLWRPGLRARVSRLFISHLTSQSVYERIHTGSGDQTFDAC